MKGLTFSHKTNVCLFVAQLCLTLCSPMKHSPQAPLFMGFSRQECWSGLPFPSPGDLPNPEIEPGSPTLQADSLLSELSGKLLLLLLSRFSHVRLCATSYTEAHQAPLSLGFSRQQCWSGLPCPLQGSSQSRDWTHVSYISCIGKRVLYH